MWAQSEENLNGNISICTCSNRFEMCKEFDDKSRCLAFIFKSPFDMRMNLSQNISMCNTPTHRVIRIFCTRTIFFADFSGSYQKNILFSFWNAMKYSNFQSITVIHIVPTRLSLSCLLHNRRLCVWRVMKTKYRCFSTLSRFSRVCVLTRPVYLSAHMTGASENVQIQHNDTHA